MAIIEQYQQHPSYLAMMTVISEDLPQGAPVCEHDDYDTILQELKKIGSLHQGSIIWSVVADQSQQLIEHQRKDIHLFAAHFLALLHQQPDESAFVCLALIQTLLTEWFDSAYPSTATAKGVKIWNNRLNQVGLRIQKNAEKTLLNERHIPFQVLVEDLLKVISHNDSLDVPELKSALRYIRDSLAAIEIDVVSPPGQTQQASIAIQSKSSSVSSSLSSKELRQSYQHIIEHLNSVDRYEPMVYRLRRHMLWGGIQSAPDKDQDGKTALFAPPVDLRDFYQQQLNESPSEEVWTRLEVSLENSPYWLTGHHLSVQYAQALGFDAIASSIKEEVQQFTQRLPHLKSLSFADKAVIIPFMDEDTQQWLGNAQPVKSSSTTEAVSNKEAGHPDPTLWIMDLPLPMDLRVSTKKALSEGDVAAVLSLFEGYLSQPLDPRARCYAQLLLAEAYETLAMTHLAVAQYRHVWTLLNLKGLNLEHWEPQLLERVKSRLLLLDNAEVHSPIYLGNGATTT